MIIAQPVETITYLHLQDLRLKILLKPIKQHTKSREIYTLFLIWVECILVAAEGRRVKIQTKSRNLHLEDHLVYGLTFGMIYNWLDCKGGGL